MTISALLEEAYASFDDAAAFMVTAEIDHPGFADTLRVVTGIDAPNGDHTVPIMLPIAVGQPPVAHTACAFGFVRPGADHDGPTEGKVQLDGVSGLIYPYLKAALGYAVPISLTVRIYRWRPAAGVVSILGPDEELAGLQISDVTLDEVRAEGTVRWPDGRQVNFPTGDDAYFDRERYPALFS